MMASLNSNKNKLTLNCNENELKHLQHSQEYVAGDVCWGKFTPVLNDFTLTDALDTNSYFRNQTHWDHAKRDKVKKFRFVVCTLALIALALSVMSRSLFNISIVEMTKDPAEHQHHEESEAETLLNAVTELSQNQNLSQDQQAEQQQLHLQKLVEDPTNSSHEIVNVFTVNDSDDENPEVGLHFKWSVKARSFVLAAFFIGYAPSMFFSGGIAERYGSMLLLSVSVVGSASINALTPYMASFSYYFLVISRITLGMLQGPLVPACYDLFNRWLTLTEMSVFVPLIKVSMAVGTLAGTMLPGLVAHSGHDWTYNFYIGSSMCLVWALFWFPMASSTPQESNWIEDNELKRIMRKKSTIVATIKLSGDAAKQEESKPSPHETEKISIPWMAIITSPSVLVLTFVKFTYNLAMDFLFIESAIYLTQIHEASIETVTLISSTGCVMQTILITFVGGLATYLVRNETFGWSKTTWRKIFQGTSNFAMAIIYYLIPFVARDQFALLVGMFIMVYFFWMFGAGGETMVPYDLSPKYPATIMGFAHSLSILSGFVLPSVGGVILGDEEKNPDNWNRLFLLISVALALGGFAFVTVIKAKPILPSERAKYDQELAAKAKSRLELNGHSRESQQQRV